MGDLEDLGEGNWKANPLPKGLYSFSFDSDVLSSLSSNGIKWSSKPNPPEIPLLLTLLSRVSDPDTPDLSASSFSGALWVWEREATE